MAVVMTAGRRARGFTYLWVLLTVALMGVGLAVGAEVYATSAQRAREQALLDIGHEFRAALASYRKARRSAGKDEYPARLEELLQDPRFPGVRRHLRRIYTDPMTGKPEWGLAVVAGKIVGVHSLGEQATFKRSNFEPVDRAFEGRTRVRDWVFTDPPDLLLRASPQDGDTEAGESVPEGEMQ